MFSKADIEKYFIAEKQLGLIGLLIGIALLLTAASFFIFLKTSFYKGAAIPLALVAILLITAGFVIYTRSDKDRIRIVYAYDMNPSELKEKELPRIKKVIKNFAVFRFIEIFLIVTGLFLFLYFRNNDDHFFWKGLGITLAIMALFLFTVDTTAGKRAQIYANGIESFLLKR
ncbi:MAG: hypothetical protein QM764_18280 [Chitinophagaceae bacterium]